MHGILTVVSRAKRDPKVMELELKNGKNHVRFCIEIYRLQFQGRRHFLHEHPEKSKAWEMPEIAELMTHPELGPVVLHMCAFGMTPIDEQGEAPVKKGTRLMSSSGDILKRVDRKCSNGTSDTHPIDM